MRARNTIPPISVGKLTRKSRPTTPPIGRNESEEVATSPIATEDGKSQAINFRKADPSNPFSRLRSKIANKVMLNQAEIEKANAKPPCCSGEWTNAALRVKARAKLKSPTQTGVQVSRNA